MVRQRVRIRFCKQGDLRLVGHRDLVRSMERLFRRAGLRLGMSEGFHPKPRMSFPSALAVGIEGLDEVMELELAESCTADALNERLARHALPGLRFASIEVLPPGEKKARIRSTSYRIVVPPERCAETTSRAGEFWSTTQWVVRRDEKRAAVDCRSDLEELTLQDGLLSMRLRNREGGAGPRDVLAALALSDLEEQGMHLTRTHVELQG
ncbi:MAG: DUF2344 domain-containing protein [Rhodopirellula sp.]|nr:DUF2344 domain-containing protein [Rhodopirellula sp.]